MESSGTLQANTESAMTTMETPPMPEHRSHWRWWLALGVLLVVLGAAALGVSAAAQLASFFIFGPLLLASSLFQLLTTFFAETGKQRLLHLAAAGLEGMF